MAAGPRRRRAAPLRAAPRRGWRRGRPSAPTRGGDPLGCGRFWRRAGGGLVWSRRPPRGCGALVDGGWMRATFPPCGSRGEADRLVPRRDHTPVVAGGGSSAPRRAAGRGVEASGVPASSGRAGGPLGIAASMASAPPSPQGSSMSSSDEEHSPLLSDSGSSRRPSSSRSRASSSSSLSDRSNPRSISISMSVAML